MNTARSHDSGIAGGWDRHHARSREIVACDARKVVTVAARHTRVGCPSDCTQLRKVGRVVSVSALAPARAWTYTLFVSGGTAGAGWTESLPLARLYLGQFSDDSVR